MTSPKICATCKREKPTCRNCKNEAPELYCQCPYPPAEKEADEMKVAEELLFPLKITGDGRILNGKEIITSVTFALHEAKAQGRREMRKECGEAVTEYFKNLVFIPDPKATRKSLISRINTIKD